MTSETEPSNPNRRQSAFPKPSLRTGKVSGSIWPPQIVELVGSRRSQGLMGWSKVVSGRPGKFSASNHACTSDESSTPNTFEIRAAQGCFTTLYSSYLQGWLLINV